MLGYRGSRALLQNPVTFILSHLQQICLLGFSSLTCLLSCVIQQVYCCAHTLCQGPCQALGTWQGLWPPGASVCQGDLLAPSATLFPVLWEPWPCPCSVVGEQGMRCSDLNAGSFSYFTWFSKILNFWGPVSSLQYIWADIYHLL